MQHGVPARSAGATGRLRSAVPRGGRRRRHLLAPPGGGAPARLQPGGRRVALAAPVGACLPAPAARLRSGRGAAGAQVATALRAHRAGALARPAVRARARVGHQPGACVLRDLGSGAVPGTVRRAARTARDARVASGVAPRAGRARRRIACRAVVGAAAVGIAHARRGACGVGGAGRPRCRPREVHARAPAAATQAEDVDADDVPLPGAAARTPARPHADSSLASREAAACRRPATAHRDALERGMARGRGSSRGRRACSARGRRARLLRQHLGPLGPAPARPACWAEPGCGWGSRSMAAGGSSCA